MNVYTKRHGNQSWSCQDIFTEHLECKPHCGATGNAQDINKVKRIQPLGIMNVCKIFCANESIKIWRYFTESEDVLVVLDDIQGIAKVIRIHILVTMNACVKSSWQYIQELQILQIWVWIEVAHWRNSISNATALAKCKWTPVPNMWSARYYTPYVILEHLIPKSLPLLSCFHSSERGFPQWDLLPFSHKSLSEVQQCWEVRPGSLSAF